MTLGSPGPLAPTLFQVFSRYKEKIRAGLQQALAQERPGLYHLLRYHMGWVHPDGSPLQASEGKALRPTLCLLACEATGGSWSSALPAAVALELVHNFSLIHDDIQDEDQERRHRPTLWYLWGKPQALIAGNTLRTVADLVLLELQHQALPPETCLRASVLLTRAYLEMIEGQYLDISYEGRLDIRLSQYLEMISRKTGALMEASLHLGASLGTEEPRVHQAFRRCGRLLGIAFQIRDDVLGIWGEKEQTGKAQGADIRRKKKSFPIVYALEKAQGKDRERLLRLYQQPSLGEEEVAEVMLLLERLGAYHYAQCVAQEKGYLALSQLEDLNLPSWAMDDFREVAHFLINRQY